jgi:hypothetical protein
VNTAPEADLVKKCTHSSFKLGRFSAMVKFMYKNEGAKLKKEGVYSWSQSYKELSFSKLRWYF